MSLPLSRRMFGALATAASLCAPAVLRAQDVAVLDLPDGLPEDVSFSFIALSLEDGARWRLRDSVLDRRLAPYSTFKVPHTLIGLREGVIEGLDHMRTRDVDLDPARPDWPDAWLEDTDLRGAFRNSVVWYYTQIARAVSGSTYRARLRDFGYGNADAGFANDRFWLDGTLQISVTEQLGFLVRLVAGYLDVPPAHLAILDELSADGEVAGQPLHGKTGMGDRIRGGGAGGWYVGWVGRRPTATVFALYCEGPSFDAIRDLRRSTAVSLLETALDGR